MSVLHNMKLFYLKKIKRQDNSTILINHLRKIGMHIGTGCCIFSEKIETAEPYLVTIGNRVMISDNVSFTTHDASAIYYLPGASDIFGRIYIGDDCFIGMGTIISSGCHNSSSLYHRGQAAWSPKVFRSRIPSSPEILQNTCAQLKN